MRTERQVVIVVRTEHEQDLARHVEWNQSEQRTSLRIRPGGRGTFAVEERIATLPYEIVFVADLHECALTQTAQHSGVEERVIFARPTTDVLERVPIVAA